MGRKFFETTDEQFEIFKNEAERWIDFFGILDASIEIVHECVDDSGTAGGCCYGDASNRAFWIAFEKEMVDQFGLGNNLSEFDIRMIAAHEVLEVLFTPIRDIAVKNGSDEDSVDALIHRLIRTFENTLIKPIVLQENENENENEFEEQKIQDECHEYGCSYCESIENCYSKKDAEKIIKEYHGDIDKVNITFAK